MLPLLHLGPFTVRTFSVTAALGILVASTLLVVQARRARDLRLTPARVHQLVWLLVAAMLAGGRLLYVAMEWAHFSRHPLEILAPWRGGLVMYGGVLAVLFAAVAFARHHDIPVLRLCDLAAPACFLGAAFGRLGCFSVGEHYGWPIRSEAWRWLGVRFTDPASAVPLVHPVTQQALRGELLYPTQLLMALKCALIAAGLAWLARRKRFDGQVVASGLLAYAVLRALVEPLRADVQRGFLGPLSAAQVISLAVFAGAALLYRWAAGRVTTPAAPARSPAPVPRPAVR